MRDTGYRKLHKLLLGKELSMKGKNNCPYAIEGFVGCFLPFRQFFFSSFECSLYKCVVIWGAWTCGAVFQYYERQRRQRWRKKFTSCLWVVCVMFENWDEREKNGGKMKRKKNSSSLSSSIDHTVHFRFYRLK